MKTPFEHYKGIEFVRISSLPEDQKRLLWDSFNTQKIIKILRDHELLNDCVPYDEYLLWHSHVYQKQAKEITKNNTSPVRVAKELKLSFNK